MIETTNILTNNKPVDYHASQNVSNATNTPSFKNFIDNELKSQATVKTSDYDAASNKIDEGAVSALERGAFEMQTKHFDPSKDASSLSFTDQLIKYKEDQLLSKPGGDYFNLGGDSKTIDYNADQSKFSARVGKDLKDAGENFLNIFKDLGTGATIKYVDKDGNIQDARKTGFAATIVNFFKDIASGLSLGAYTPEGERAPENALDTVKHFFKKIFVDGLFKDVVVGVPRSAIHVGEDMVFASINLVETIPDATIGNCKAGQVATTEVFDNAQVFVDFVTDVLPMGEAGSRTHAFTFKKGLKGLPIVYNITSPEKGMKEDDWKYVRNTPFRKTIESIATIMPIKM